jgi:hypothetical protein
VKVFFVDCLQLSWRGVDELSARLTRLVVLLMMTLVWEASIIWLSETVPPPRRPRDNTNNEDTHGKCNVWPPKLL